MSDILQLKTPKLGTVEFWQYAVDEMYRLGVKSPEDFFKKLPRGIKLRCQYCGKKAELVAGKCFECEFYEQETPRDWCKETDRYKITWRGKTLFD